MYTLPTREKQEVCDLIEQIDLSKEDTFIYISDETLETFRDLIKEWNNKEIFAEHNLPVRNKILLYGLSGNGKTTLAKFLARKASLPMVSVRYEKLISALIGETGKHLASIFDSINEPCILFFDEIDSVAMERISDGKSSSASEEYNKALNVMLIKMERMSPDVVFIGATNRKNHLDAAFLRRFDMLHEMPAPELKDKIKFIERTVKHYKVDAANFDNDVKERILELDSFSDIKRSIVTIARKQILETIK